MEIWSDIKGYEGKYQVSTLGNVRSLDRYIITKNGISRFVRGRLLKPHKIPKGYLQVKLPERLTVVHRIVAETFIGEPPTPNHVINHIDLNKENNDVSNLEWVTPQENTQHAWINGACAETLKKRSTQVINLATKEKYPSVIEASRILNIPYATLHRWCTKNKGYSFIKG